MTPDYARAWIRLGDVKGAAAGVSTEDASLSPEELDAYAAQRRAEIGGGEP